MLGFDVRIQRIFAAKPVTPLKAAPVPVPSAQPPLLLPALLRASLTAPPPVCVDIRASTTYREVPKPSKIEPLLGPDLGDLLFAYYPLFTI